MTIAVADFKDFFDRGEFYYGASLSAKLNSLGPVDLTAIVNQKYALVLGVDGAAQVTCYMDSFDGSDTLANIQTFLNSVLSQYGVPATFTLTGTTSAVTISIASNTVGMGSMIQIFQYEGDVAYTDLFSELSISGIAVISDFSVRDKDIQNAIDMAGDIFNDSLYPDNTTTKAQCYLTAHFLQTDIDAIVSGSVQPDFLMTAKAAQGVSASYEIPDWMKTNDFYFYTTTIYGYRFLMLSKPYLDGGVFSVAGATQP